jgi:uncharacterized coiled-coil protein SlyX
MTHDTMPPSAADDALEREVSEYTERVRPLRVRDIGDVLGVDARPAAGVCDYHSRADFLAGWRGGTRRLADLESSIEVQRGTIETLKETIAKLGAHFSKEIKRLEGLLSERDEVKL